ncbi:MAG TPA: ribosome small subunit-dependent GTPase A [Terriglobia bacterium]|nr:ribosome small subunit-dependent GTPase A [Terriglobia bacterium]
MDLRILGWNDHFADHWKINAGRDLRPGRVVEEQKEAYRVAGEDGEMQAEVIGRLRYEALDRSAFPAVGDWVAMHTLPAEGKALIHEILPRRTKLSRKVAGERAAEQILVTNVDVAFVVMSLNADFNVRRLERYLGVIRESGAEPVVLLSKADLCSDTGKATADLVAVAPGINSHILSARTGEGMAALAPYIEVGRTVVLLGSSGVGKSTIINRLLGSDAQKTLEIRSGDERGRHATTYRRLFLMPSGGVLIDTPGMRELQLWDADRGLDDVFEDLAILGSKCRFRDCQHQTEPGCAVLEAIADGTLEPGRIDNFKKLKREQQFLERRRDAAAQAEQKKLWKRRHRALRHHYKSQR